MTADKLIKACVVPVDILIVEFDNGTSEEYDLWNEEIEKFRHRKIDAFDMYESDEGKTLQIWL